MIILKKLNKVISIGLIIYVNPIFAANIGDFKIGMGYKEASAIGIHHCEPTLERVRATTKFYEATICKFSFDEKPPPKRGPNNVVIKNSSKRVDKISTFILTNDFTNKAQNYPKYSLETLNSWVDDQILKDYKISRCPREYYPEKGYSLYKACIFPPNIIRWINYPAYMRRGHVVLGAALEIEIYSNNEEYSSIMKNTIAVDKRKNAELIHKEKQKKIANDIQKGQ